MNGMLKQMSSEKPSVKKFVAEGEDRVVFTTHKYVVEASSEEEAVSRLKELMPNFRVKTLKVIESYED